MVGGLVAVGLFGSCGLVGWFVGGWTWIVGGWWWLVDCPFVDLWVSKSVGRWKGVVAPIWACVGALALVVPD